MSEVRGRQFLASGVRSVANHVANAEASLNMECDRSLKYGGIGAQKSLGSCISAAASYCVGKCWLLTAGISLLAEDQKEIHRDKKSLIKGSGRLWPRLRQTCLLASVCLHLGMQNNFWTLQTLHSTIIHNIHSLHTSVHKTHIPLDHKVWLSDVSPTKMKSIFEFQKDSSQGSAFPGLNCVITALAYFNGSRWAGPLFELH